MGCDQSLDWNCAPARGRNSAGFALEPLGAVERKGRTIVPLAIYYFHRDHEADAEKFQTLFTDATIEFSGLVRPGDRVRTEAQLVFYRRRKVRVEATMKTEDGKVVCSGQLAGMGVPR